MKIFVFADTRIWFEGCLKIFGDQNVEVTYFCSPDVPHLFEPEIASGLITSLDLKTDCEYLIENFDLGFSCHCRQIFPAQLVKNVRCINIHSGLNPHNRGWYPQVFVLLHGRPSGVTIHLMDEEIDTGAILYQREVEAYPWDTSKTLYDRIMAAEFELLADNLRSLIDETYKATPMAEGGSYNSRQDFRSLFEIDLNKQVTMAEAINHLRAVTHEPYRNAYFLTEDGEKVYVSLNISKDSS